MTREHVTGKFYIGDAVEVLKGQSTARVRSGDTGVLIGAAEYRHEGWLGRVKIDRTGRSFRTPMGNLKKISKKAVRCCPCPR